MSHLEKKYIKSLLFNHTPMTFNSNLEFEISYRNCSLLNSSLLSIEIERCKSINTE